MFDACQTWPLSENLSTLGKRIYYPGDCYRGSTQYTKWNISKNKATFSMILHTFSLPQQAGVFHQRVPRRSTVRVWAVKIFWWPVLVGIEITVRLFGVATLSGNDVELVCFEFETTVYAIHQALSTFLPSRYSSPFQKNWFSPPSCLKWIISVLTPFFPTCQALGAAVDLRGSPWTRWGEFALGPKGD